MAKVVEKNGILTVRRANKNWSFKKDSMGRLWPAKGTSVSDPLYPEVKALVKESIS